MPGLTFRLLGGCEVIDASGQPVLLRRKKKARALLAFLAVQLDRPQSRDVVAGLLWGESEERSARVSLRQVLSILRRSVPGPDRDALRLDDEDILVTSAGADVDAVTFRGLMATGTASAFEKAAAIYRGPLLGNFSTGESAFDSWLDAERDDFHRMAVTAHRSILRTRIASDETEAAEETAVRLLSLDATQEDIHRQLIEIYIAQKRRDQALRQYEECRNVLRRELALSPDRKTEALIAGIRDNSTPVQQPDLAPRPTPAVRPSPAIVAVLPFTGVPTGHTSGLTSDVTRMLSAWRHLAVVGRGTMLSYAARSTKARDLAQELGVAYVIEGEVRVRTEGAQAQIDLVDALTGCILWTETFAVRRKDRDEADNELARRIAARATHEIDRADWRRARLEQSGRLDLWQYFQRGCALRSEYGVESNRRAQEMFKRALDLDPAFAPAMAALARTYHDDWALYHIAEGSISLCVETARRAIDFDDLDSMAHVALSAGACRSHDHRLAVDEGQEAIRLNPSNAVAHIVAGNALAFAGNPTAGVARIKKGLVLTSPHDSAKSHRMHMFARSHLNARNHGAAVKWAERSIHQRPNSAFTHFVHASALAHLRRWSEAEAAIERSLATDPGIVEWEFNQSAGKYANPADQDHVLDGVRQLGFG